MAIREAIGNLFGRGPDAGDDTRQLLAQEAANVEMLQERLAELELALEDEGWMRLALAGEREFSRDGLQRIIALSRLMYLKNPLVQRAIEVRCFYIWGQGVEIQSRSEAVDEVVQQFMSDKGNRRELFRHQAHTAKEQQLELDGNLFLALFTNLASGRVQVRTIDVDEIDNIVCNPDDRNDVWYYHRRWTGSTVSPLTGATVHTTREAYYPAVGYTPPANARPKTIGQVPIRWDAPVYHVKVGGLSGMRFGVPETYAALDWARAHKSFLEDWASIVRSLSRFAWALTTKSGKVASAKKKLGSTLGTGTQETNPPAATGAAFVHDEGVSLTPIPKTGTTHDAGDGKQLRLMVAAALHLPDTILSNDPQQGALATAKTLDRPTELAMEDRQKLWAGVLQDIFDYVVLQSVKAPGGSLAGSVAVDSVGDETVVLVGEDDATVDVTFPSILEHDMRERVGAIISAATLDGKSLAGTVDRETLIRMLLVELGAEDVDELLDKAMAEFERLEAEKAEQAAAMMDNLAGGDGRPEDRRAAEEAFRRAVTNLREALGEGE